MWQYNELYHHGILGQKWGIRRYQNKDGTLTEAGRKRYGTVGKGRVPFGAIAKDDNEYLRQFNEKKSRSVTKLNQLYNKMAELDYESYWAERENAPNKDALLKNYNDVKQEYEMQLKQVNDEATKAVTEFLLQKYGSTRVSKYNRTLQSRLNKSELQSVLEEKAIKAQARIAHFLDRHPNAMLSRLSAKHLKKKVRSIE